MKRILLFIFLITVTFTSVNAQKKVSKQFEQKTKLKYEKLKNKELSFQEFLKFERLEQARLEKLKANPKLKYKPTKKGDMCSNGDFESGISPTLWDAAYGSVLPNSSPNLSTWTLGFSSGNINTISARQTLVSAGPDPNCAIDRVNPNSQPISTKAMRIGNSKAGKGAEMLSRTFEVKAENPSLSFWYAVVFQDPGHSPASQPSFWVRILKGNNEITGLVDLRNGSNKVVADASGFFKKAGNLVVYKDWSCVDIDLSKHIGETLTIQFITEDCSHGAHFGYAYIDDFCGSCKGDPEGWVEFNKGKTNCKRGQICFDYGLPAVNGKKGTGKIKLSFLQNGVVKNTMDSPIFNSGNQYCFSFKPCAIKGIDPSKGGFDFVATATFKLGGATLTKIAGDFVSGVQDKTNDDCKCSNINEDLCCPGKNLVKNGNFENGNNDFSSEFKYTNQVQNSSVVPGKYSILNGDQAAIVSPTWSTVNDPTTCKGNQGNFLVVNGQNGAGPLQKTSVPVPPKKVVWEQTVSVDKWKFYKFCFKAKNLSQRGFDIIPMIDVKLVNSNVTGIQDREIKLINVPSCDWVDVEKRFNLWGHGNGQIKIQIILDQDRHGDGNDLAIDNIALVKLEECPAATANFDIQTFDKNGYFEIEAKWNKNGTCDYGVWEACEVNPQSLDCINGTKVYGPSAWINNSTKFPGYQGNTQLSNTSTPGRFEYGKFYRIIRGVWSECRGWTATKMIVFKDPGNNRIRTYSEKDFKVKKKEILRSFKMKPSKTLKKRF